MIEFTSAPSITVTVNGRNAHRQINAATTLAEFLRDDLGLTGTKVSCELQVCGACTVLVDGHPVSACTYLAVDAAGRSVRTVEGLAPDGNLDVVQQAFINNFALQCGFCTPGFVMMTHALLEEIPDPSRADVMHYLEGNICRCTGYRSILEAVLSVSDAPLDNA